MEPPTHQKTANGIYHFNQLPEPALFLGKFGEVQKAGRVGIVLKSQILKPSGFMKSLKIALRLTTSVYTRSTLLRETCGAFCGGRCRTDF